jgi:hypothetical protein
MSSAISFPRAAWLHYVVRERATKLLGQVPHMLAVKTRANVLAHFQQWSGFLSMRTFWFPTFQTPAYQKGVRGLGVIDAFA